MHSVDNARILVLMYHSISSGGGPTNIPTDVFKEQLEVLDECSYRVVPLAELVAWYRGEAELGERTAVITFDDGFQDFADAALPALKAKSWSSTVFLPVAKVGGSDDWEHDSGRNTRPIMSWQTVTDLAQPGQGVEFGAHTFNHVDLTRLKDEALFHEIVHAKAELEDRLSQPVPSFAPPYGKTNRRALDLISSVYTVSVGTRLDETTRASKIHDLPRIEMHYFRQPQLWRDFLNGNAKSFFALRKSLRKIRGLVFPY